ncbi:MAG: hypothetical protein EP317_04410 [Bacillota bacterium]|nr:MAG: hypothetical protein EP317_04410 [Bacillota bacterium]
MIDKLLQHKKVKLNHIPNSYEKSFHAYQQHDGFPYDIIFSFVHSLEEMKHEILSSINILDEQGLLYMCYPKLKNQLGLKGIHRDHIFPYLHVNEDTGYIADTFMRFNKMLSFDSNYTMLVVKKDTIQRKRSSTSQKVEDYTQHIDDIKDRLKHETCYQFFLNLTPGYQKGWARYVFSAKTDETKEKRIHEMIDLLGKGVKSKDLAGKV